MKKKPITDELNITLKKASKSISSPCPNSIILQNIYEALENKRTETQTIP